MTNNFSIPTRHAGSAPPVPAPPPHLLSVAAAARFADMSPASWRKLDSAGRCPAPVRLGRRVRWRLADLEAWADAGCPPRDADASRAYAAASRASLDRLRR